ncbi:ribosomal protein S15 [Batrachochytrium salamandrivorans]|nr:ribosomal protein S15 [Batrachochytrium salamandrivorans]
MLASTTARYATTAIKSASTKGSHRPPSSLAGFHTAAILQSRFPAQINRISRKAHEKNLLKIAQLKAKLGPKYRPLGREKRVSPLTDVRSPSKPSQPPRPIPKPVRLSPFLASQANRRPLDIVPGGIDEVLEKSKELLEKADQESHAADGNKAASKINPANMSIRVRTSKPVVKGLANDETTLLRLPETVRAHLKPRSKVSTAKPIDTTSETSSDIGSGLRVFEPITAVGPFYRYGLTPSDVKAILSDTPKTLLMEGAMNSSDRTEEQAEMVRRIISLENGNESALRKFNIARSVEVFQRAPGDTGSPEVQAAVFSVRIDAINKHLSTNRKDKSTKRQLMKWVSKRERILKYLRRKNIATFVKTCQSIGVDPDTIRV